MIRRIGDSSGLRLTIIGLDGASFNYLDPILESGKLPNFQRFFNSGVHSGCLSTIPPLTPPAWSTMLTGVNPGKHGIFDFMQPDREGAFRMVDASTRRRKSFLDHAAENDIRTLGILVPYTYPPDPLSNGLVVSGLGTPSWESDFIRPHSLRDRLLNEFPFLRETDPTKGQTIETLHASLHEHTKSTIDLTRFAMSEIDDWGICFVVFQATDLIPHFYCKYFDPSHPDYTDDAPEEYKNGLSEIYIAIDSFLGECLDRIENEGGWVMLVSDHGSQPLMGAIGKDAFLFRWLETEGYLVSGGPVARAGDTARAQMGSVANRWLHLAKKYTPHGFRDAVNRLLGRRKEEITSALTSIPFMDGIDWSETLAFCAPGGYGSGLYINREDDFPGGSVPKGATYFNLREEIRSKLSSIEIAPGVPLFTMVLPREEALWGPEVECAPDLLLLWSEDRRIRENDFTLVGGLKLDPPGLKEGSGLTWSGTHRMEGLFGMTGTGIRRGEKLNGLTNLADILPAVHLVGRMPVPADVDGRVIESIFEPEFLSGNPPVEGPPEGPGGERQTVPVSPEDSDKLIDLLSGLGYLH